ncbi:DsbE family thiol:disulfide interchange protein [Kiloniella sp. b19]|uniref:DsbE family thiol:disulfide interchange protein n=1 Tax=Kiloniella sp. GXU_MW_B19 TaxID=3141326 RepID=UPI0031DC14AF
MTESTPKSPTRTRLLFLLPLLLVSILFGYFLWGLTTEGRDPNKIPSVLIDKPAPDFDLPALEGTSMPGFSTADLRNSGKISVVNVFASWCIPCLAEHPNMMKLGQRDDIVLYGINYRDKPLDALNWLEKHGNPYDSIGADTNSRASINWGVYGVPETFILDQSGTIRYKHTGPINPGQLESLIIPVIETLKAEKTS